MFLSRGIGSTVDPLQRIQSSRLTAQDRPRGVRDAGTGTISTEEMSSMITDPIVMVDVECQPLPRGVGHMRLDIEMTDVLIALGRGFHSTPGTQALM